MTKKVKDAKEKLEKIFNSPARIVDNAVKVNLKQIDPKAFVELASMISNSEVCIKRSGPGLTIIVNPN